MDKSQSSSTERFDGEVTVVAKVVRIMKTLDPQGQERVAAYIHERFGQASLFFPIGRPPLPPPAAPPPGAAA